MLKVASMVDVDTFIERATEISDRIKRNPSLYTEAKQDARVLMEQFEVYLEAKGLSV